MERRTDWFTVTERTHLYVEDEDEKIELAIPIVATLVGILMTIFAAAIGGFWWGLGAYLLFGAVQCGSWPFTWAVISGSKTWPTSWTTMNARSPAPGTKPPGATATTVHSSLSSSAWQRARRPKHC